MTPARRRSATARACQRRNDALGLKRSPRTGIGRGRGVYVAGRGSLERRSHPWKNE